MAYFDNVPGEGRAVIAGFGVVGLTIASVVGICSFSPDRPGDLSVKSGVYRDGTPYVSVKANQDISYKSVHELDDAISLLDAMADKLRKARERMAERQ